MFTANGSATVTRQLGLLCRHHDDGVIVFAYTARAGLRSYQQLYHSIMKVKWMIVSTKRPSTEH